MGASKSKSMEGQRFSNFCTYYLRPRHIFKSGKYKHGISYTKKFQPKPLFKTFFKRMNIKSNIEMRHIINIKNQKQASSFIYLFYF